MLWKKKTETKEKLIVLSDRDKINLQKLAVFRERVYETQQDLNFGNITKTDFNRKMASIHRGLDSIEEEMCGEIKRVEYTEDVFDSSYNEEIHKAIEGVADDQKHSTS